MRSELGERDHNSMVLHEMAAHLEEISRQVAAMSVIVRSRLVEIPSRPDLAIIVEAVANATGVPIKVIHGRNRLARNVMARHMAYWLCTELTNYSRTKIGEHFHCDPTSIRHGRDQVEIWRLRKDERFARVTALRVMLEAQFSQLQETA